MLPTTQFAYRICLGTCDALLCISHILQCALESEQEARIVQSDCSEAFDRVSHQGILYRLCMLCGYWRFCVVYTDSFCQTFLQHVMLDCCRSKLVDIVSGVPQGSVLGPLLFLLHTSEHFSILENRLIGYADDSTLIAIVPSSGVRVTVAESLIRDLGRVCEWCDLWGIELNASKAKTIMVSRSHTMHPQSPH